MTTDMYIGLFTVIFFIASIGALLYVLIKLVIKKFRSPNKAIASAPSKKGMINVTVDGPHPETDNAFAFYAFVEKEPDYILRPWREALLKQGYKFKPEYEAAVKQKLRTKTFKNPLTQQDLKEESPYAVAFKSKTFTAIDFETANAGRNSACSVGYVRVVNGHITEQGYSLIKPKNAVVNAINRGIHGISDEEIAIAPSFEEVWATLEPFITNQIVVAHNCAFDIDVLKAMLVDHALPLPELRYMCSQKLAQEAFSDLKNYRLNDAAAHLGIELMHHDALSDAKACALVTLEALKTNDFIFDYSLSELTQQISKRASETKKDRSLSGVYGQNKLDKKRLKPNLAAADIGHPFYNKGINITGELFELSRQDAAEKAQAAGANLKTGISKLCHYVVVGINPGPAKLRKVEELKEKGYDIRLINEAEFLELLQPKPVMS